MRLLSTLLAYLVSLVIVGAVSAVVVWVLAGPHAGLLPSWLEMLVLCLGWIAVMVLPIVVAVKTWKRAPYARK